MAAGSTVGRPRAGAADDVPEVPGADVDRRQHGPGTAGKSRVSPPATLFLRRVEEADRSHL